MTAAQYPEPHAVPTFDPARQRPVIPTGLELVVNALDIDLQFEVGGVPGSPAGAFYLQPGQYAYMPQTYCKPIPGANPKIPRPSVLAMLTSVEPWPGGPQIQGVVPVNEREATAARWAKARADAPRAAVVMLQDQDGRNVEVQIPKPRPPEPPRARQRVEEDDEDDDEIEEPPPSGPPRELVQAAPPAEAKKGAKGPKGAKAAPGPKVVDAGEAEG